MNMDVIWTKDKLCKILSKETLTFASGDGASTDRCCRLCGGDNSLRYLRDTYVWEGVEERYDQLLYDCFGVRVSSSDCMICEWCVRQLRSTQRFRALVHAAFEHLSSSSNHSRSKDTIRPTQNKNVSNINNKEIIHLLKTKMVSEGAKKGLHQRRKNAIIGSNVEQKRLNLQCAVCRQRYPMIVPFDGWKNFVCSRCKKYNITKLSCKKCNVQIASNLMKEHLESHAKADLRGKIRFHNLPKKSSRTDNTECNNMSGQLTKYKRKLCSNKYSTDTFCVICRKDYKTQYMLNKHMQTHTGSRDKYNKFYKVGTECVHLKKSASHKFLKI
ncbi:uncharacterized protein LOC128202125 [Galleria mellonella]|uniref:Uncharacterized protein LOC128202125 n=1 Tax=Galleria mellonella TaxID=7137 RepID=A0ABM3N0Y2_GALME|nr:uncharacterized protein LOC128202125 [Galleria mellonella]